MQCCSCSFVGKSFKVDQNRAPHQETGYLGSIVTRVKAFLLIGCTTGLRDPTLRASQWLLGRNLKSQCRLRHMRRAIARARLCARLKDWRRAKKARLVWLRKLQDVRQIARLKQQLLWNTNILRENQVYLFVISLVQWWKLYYQKQRPEVLYIKRCS